MAAGIITALCTWVAENGAMTVWDGEAHRYDAQGQSVGPDGSAGQSGWPVVKFTMPDKAAFRRKWNFEDTYHDEGVITCQIWHHTRALAEKTMDKIETLLAVYDNWAAIGRLIPSPYVENPHYVIQMLLESWSSVQEEGIRTMKSELIYKCELIYMCYLHGAIPVA